MRNHTAAVLVIYFAPTAWPGPRRAEAFLTDLHRTGEAPSFPNAIWSPSPLDDEAASEADDAFSTPLSRPIGSVAR